jgi:hypothetical protein
MTDGKASSGAEIREVPNIPQAPQGRTPADLLLAWMNFSRAMQEGLGSYEDFSAWCSGLSGREAMDLIQAIQEQAQRERNWVATV